MQKKIYKLRKYKQSSTTVRRELSVRTKDGSNTSITGVIVVASQQKKSDIQGNQSKHEEKKRSLNF